MALAFQVTKQGIQLVEPRIRRLDAMRGRTFSAASTLLFELMQLGVYLVPQLRDAEPAGLGIKVRLPLLPWMPLLPWASAVHVCTPWAAPLVFAPHVCTPCVHHSSGPLVLALHLLAPLVIANVVCTPCLQHCPCTTAIRTTFPGITSCNCLSAWLVCLSCLWLGAPAGVMALGIVNCVLEQGS